MRERTNITLDPQVKAAALAHAKGKGKSLSEVVERYLEDLVSGGEIRGVVLNDPVGKIVPLPSARNVTDTAAKKYPPKQKRKSSG